MMRRLLQTLLIALITTLPASGQEYEAAPDFTLPGLEQAVTLSKLKGDVVYVDFWASWCDPCRHAFEWMNSMQSYYEHEGLTVIAINLDKDRAKADQFLAENPAHFTVLFDPEGEVAETYKLRGMPSSYLIDRQGRLVISHLGFRSRDKIPLQKNIVNLLAGREP